jgi:hypothetical protein
MENLMHVLAMAVGLLILYIIGFFLIVIKFECFID